MADRHEVDESSLPEATAAAARRAMRTFDDAEIPFLVSGAYALAFYTGIERHTKDFDVCVRASDIDRALEALDNEGFETELSSELWLAKAHADDQLIDLVFNSGHAEHPVDDTWFDRAPKQKMLGRQAEIAPVEELIRSKAFIMERERFDGADVAHLLRCTAEELDWQHLLEIFGEHWPVLHAHLVLFQYIYPAQRNLLPETLMEELAERLKHQRQEPLPEKDICRGTLLSRTQYLVDIDQWGCTDGRIQPHGTLSPTQARGLSPRPTDDESSN